MEVFNVLIRNVYQESSARGIEIVLAEQSVLKDYALIDVETKVTVESFKTASMDVVFHQINVQDFQDVCHSRIAIRALAESNVDLIGNVGLKWNARRDFVFLVEFVTIQRNVKEMSCVFMENVKNLHMYVLVLEATFA